MKKWIALVLVLLMVLPLAACGKEEEEPEVLWEYDESNYELTITGGEMGNYGEIERPWQDLEIWTLKIEGVTSVGDWAFAGCKTLRSVIIDDGVTSIGAGAFADCEQLISVQIPDSVKSIGDQCFRYCYWLQQVELPGGIPAIADGTFVGCISLPGIVIPASVETVGAAAFYGCENLTSVYFGGSSAKWQQMLGSSHVLAGNEPLLNIQCLG